MCHFIRLNNLQCPLTHGRLSQIVNRLPSPCPLSRFISAFGASGFSSDVPIIGRDRGKIASRNSHKLTVQPTAHYFDRTMMVRTIENANCYSSSCRPSSCKKLAAICMEATAAQQRISDRFGRHRCAVGACRAESKQQNQVVL